ncbi:MAG: methylmalonyl-CoA mutase small subunit [Bacteroidales bacterium]|nr:methylmalonyl-CoA mutase small subunit [Bacteroidales bacterium]
METDHKKEKLFTEFPPVSTEKWEEVLNKDLKGADYDRKLVWKTKEGFKVKPYYRDEDLENLGNPDVLPDQFPFVRGKQKTSNDWYVRQDTYVHDIEESNKKALDILMKGVTSLGFVIDPKFEPTVEDIEQLCTNIYADAVELNFICYKNSLNVVRSVEKLARKYNRDLEKIYGSVDFDPLGQYVLRGKFPVSAEASFDLAKEVMEAAKHLPNFKVITVNASYFHNSGATLVESTAFALAQGVNYLTQLTERGLSINEVAPRIKFNFAIGPNYFMEIAKIRAARLLWAQIVKAYGPSDDSKTKMNIHAETSLWNKSVYDPYVNMLRTTTETMSALIGGVDSMTVIPFNEVYERPTPFSERIARNQQLLLKEESYFDKVVDPAAGSYYIENLTASIAEEAWKIFLEVQEKGGFMEAFKSGFIQEKINESARQRDMDIATRKEVILGTNQYPNGSEVKEVKLDETIFQPYDQSDKNAEVETLKPYRGPQAFENLRYHTDQYARENGRPKVFLITMGNLAMRRARAQFAANFFGCAGYEIIDNIGFKSIDEAAEACKKSQSQVAVICSSDDEYAELAPKLADLLKDSTTLVLAGYPKELVDELKAKGITHFIHMKSNVLETLQEFQKIIGIV